MTETLTPSPAAGWTMTVVATGLTYKIIAHNGNRVIHADKLTAADVTSFDPEVRWATGLSISPKFAAMKKGK